MGLKEIFSDQVKVSRVSRKLSKEAVDVAVSTCSTSPLLLFLLGFTVL
jgi:hypothetical protein